MPDFTNNKPKGALITERATALLSSPGATFDRFCGECKMRVMISPVGLRALQADPTLSILCMDCHMRHNPELPLVMRYPGTMEELARDLASARPNPWRTRN